MKANLSQTFALTDLPRTVPAADLHAQGWDLECIGCGRTIFADEVAVNAIGTLESGVYCHPLCSHADIAASLRRSRGADAWLQLLRDNLLRSVPGSVPPVSAMMDEVRFVEKDLKRFGMARVTVAWPPVPGGLICVQISSNDGVLMVDGVRLSGKFPAQVRADILQQIKKGFSKK